MIPPHLATFIYISTAASNQASAKATHTNASPVVTEWWAQETVLYIICDMFNPHKSQLVTEKKVKSWMC